MEEAEIFRNDTEKYACAEEEKLDKGNNSEERMFKKTMDRIAIRNQERYCDIEMILLFYQTATLECLPMSNQLLGDHECTLCQLSINDLLGPHHYGQTVVEISTVP